MLSSTVAQLLSSYSQVALFARQIVDKIINGPINSKDGIKQSLDIPLNS